MRVAGGPAVGVACLEQLTVGQAGLHGRAKWETKPPRLMKTETRETQARKRPSLSAHGQRTWVSVMAFRAGGTNTAISWYSPAIFSTFPLLFWGAIAGIDLTVIDLLYVVKIVPNCYM
jgi:hypothetical protein